MIYRPWTGQNKPPRGARPIPGHALTPTAAWLCNERSGPLVADAMRTGSDGAATAGDSWDADSLYLNQKYVDVGNGWPFAWTGSISLVLFAQRQWDSSRWLFGKCGTIGERSFGLLNASATSVAMYVAPNATALTFRTSGTGGSLGAWEHIVGVYNAVARTLDVYRNGVLDNGSLSGTVPAAQYVANGRNVCLGAGGSGYSPSVMYLGHAAYVQRALSATEIAAMAAQPYSWLGVPDLASMGKAIPAAAGVYPIFGGEHVIQGAWQL